jgi:hypothetical protein
MSSTSFRKTPVLFLIVLSAYTSTAQKELYKNDYVVYDVSSDSGKYKIDYIFKDQFGNRLHFKLELTKTETDRMISRFGVPKKIFSAHRETVETKARNMQIIRNGLFLLNDNTVEPDKSAVIDYYAKSFCRPIAGMIVEVLQKRNQDTRKNRIEMAMRFVQDIPYAVPQCNDKNKYCGGVNPPPKLLIDGYGDCDSKAIFFAGILIWLIDSQDIIFLVQRKHILTAIRTKTKEKSLNYVRYHGNNYLIAETAGPGKRLLGQKGKYFSKTFKVEKIEVNPVKIIPIQ